MKRSILFTFLMALSVSVFSQSIGKTYLGFSANITEYDDSYKELGVSNSSVFLECWRSWNKHPEKPFSLVAELGGGIKHNSLARKPGGLGVIATYDGNFWQMMGGASLLGQFKVEERTAIQLGSRVEGLLVGYEKSEYDWRVSSSLGWEFGNSGTIKVNEFNRNYFNKIYYGLQMKILTWDKDEGPSYGLNVCYLLTKKTSSNFRTEHLLRLGIFIEIK